MRISEEKAVVARLGSAKVTITAMFVHAVLAATSMHAESDRNAAALPEEDDLDASIFKDMHTAPSADSVLMHAQASLGYWQRSAWRM